MKVGLNLVDTIYGLREISTFEMDVKKQVKGRLLSTRKVLVVIRFTRTFFKREGSIVAFGI